MNEISNLFSGSGWAMIVSLVVIISSTAVSQYQIRELRTDLSSNLEKQDTYLKQQTEIQIQVAQIQSVQLLHSNEITKIDINHDSIEELEKGEAVTNEIVSKLNDTITRLNTTLDKISDKLDDLDHRVDVLER